MYENDPRAAEARRLRTEEGLSRQQIRDKLRAGNDKLDAWLKNVPPPEWTKRPKAKDRLRDMARQMRQEGKAYNEIARTLNVSKSSVSLWVRDIPVPKPPTHPSWTAEARQRRSETLAKKHARQDEDRLEQQANLRKALEPFDSRDLLLSGAIAYWCEGAKVKPWRRNDVRVVFTNSDPDLIRLFMRFVEHAPVEHGDFRFYVHLHESADEAQAKAFWCGELGIDEADFLPTLWKRHNPKTVRNNVRDGYNGCLVVRVRKSRKLYWYIENLAKAALKGMSGAMSGT